MPSTHKRQFTYSLAVLLASVGPVTAADMGTEVTYQGNLTDGGGPITGQVDMLFTLYDADVGGNVVGTTAIFDGQAGNGAPVDVTNGLLTVSPDFGADVFDGTALWLEIQVRNPHDPTDTALYDLLDPRQPLTAAPVSLQTRGLFVDNASNVTLAPNNNNTASGFSATVGGGFDNAATDAFSTIGGGESNTAAQLNSTIGGGIGNTIGASGAFGTIAGGTFNTIPGNGTANNTIGGAEFTPLAVF